MGMVIKREYELEDMDYLLWSGAREKWVAATDDQRERVWTLLKDVFEGSIPELTTVNDFIWFECDDIFDESGEDNI